MKDFISQKLGFCRRCIKIAAIGTFLSWALYILFGLIFDSSFLMGLILIIAVGFTILLLAHLVAYFLRVYLPLNKALRNLEVISADISISTLTPEQVTGAFTQGNIGLSFDVAFRDEHMSLIIRDLQGRDLLIAEESNGHIEQSILDGRMTVSVPKLVLSEDMSEREIDIVIEKHLSEVSIQGEEDGLRELQELPEFRLLPVLSKALGISGISGDRFSAIVSLHYLALGTFTFQQKQQRDNGVEPPPDGGQPDVVYRIKHPFQNQLLADTIFDFTDDDIVPCNPLVNEINMYPPGYDEPWLGGCSKSGCNATCKCSDDKPNRDDDCLGMCGKGCCCWCDICGDCCFHQGCYVHDKWCGRCAAGDINACIGCYGPPAGIGFVCR